MRYEIGFYIGSEDDDGGHRRDLSGWPYSIYRQAREIGATDVVLCHGIQDLNDAKQLLALTNGDVRPAIQSACQVFAWD